MEFYVDIADIEQVEQVGRYFPIDGFTTNPVILTRSEKDPAVLMQAYKAYTDRTGQKLFVQVTAEKAEDMHTQALQLQAYFGENLLVKIPATYEGYRAMLLCRQSGVPFIATVVHSATQALMAAKAGAAYVAPYVTHIDNIGADGIGAVADMVAAFADYGYDCKVLGASFRTADQILRLMQVGCHAVTVTPEMFRTLISHASTDQSMAGFRAKWQEAYGQKQITDFLK